MLIECYVKGAVAGVNGETVDANPYVYETKSHDDWLVGHCAGVTAQRRKLAASVVGRTVKGSSLSLFN